MYFFFVFLFIISILKKLFILDIFLLIFWIMELIFNWYLRKLFCLVYFLSMNMVICVYEYERFINLIFMYKKEKKNVVIRNVFYIIKIIV